ncbi:MAG: two-component system LytT family sensor kinase [Maribacter sp.]|jgi:two-component system LytT family sensor kinase
MKTNRNNWLRIHLALWCFMLLFVFDYHWFDITWQAALGYTVLEVSGYIILFYANSYILKVFENKKYALLKSISSSILLAILYALVIKNSRLEELLYIGGGWRNLFSIMVNASLFIGLSYLFYTSKKYIDERSRNLELIAENRQMQLDNLKARINPHFIFNTLNNMYALIVKKDERVPLVVSKLSTVLRYAVDNDSSKKSSLKKEIQHLEDYLELIKLQEPLAENIDFYAEGNFNDQEIIPFILITFLENAVKHGDVMYNRNGLLHLNISIDNDFIFEIKNTTSNDKIATSGQGFKNVERQLELAYRNNYSLEKKISNNVFKVVLKIKNP